jgi:hypothetical protein
MGCKLFKTFKTIEVGTGLVTAEDFRQAFKRSDCFFTKSANGLLDVADLQISPIKRTVDLVAVDISDITGHSLVRLTEIYRRARLIGLELCTTEMALQLRLQHSDQPLETDFHRGDLIVATTPIWDRAGKSTFLFGLIHNKDGLLIMSKFNCGSWEDYPGHKWIFVNPST